MPARNAALLWVVAMAIASCSSDSDLADDGGAPMASDGSTAAGSGGAKAGSGGAQAQASGGTGHTGGTSGGGGSASAGTSGGSGMGAAGSTADAGGDAGGTGGNGEETPPPPLDCGPDGWVVENHGPPANRVNYLILADGYDSTTIDTTLEEHVKKAMARRFEQENGEPYGRYRNFVNICVAKVVSENNGIGNGPTAFDGGNGGDRLAAVNESKVNAYIKANIPASFEIDWKAVVLNQDKWENTGAILMLWSGANKDAAGAALHEGGHGFHQLADEYGDCTGGKCGSNTCGDNGMAYQEVNSAGNCETTDGKWDLWLGTTQKALKDVNGTATGLQGTWSGSRYVGSGQYRPSANSMMNSLFGDTDPKTSFNSVSREQIVMSIWRAVTPIDSADPPAGDLTNPPVLKVNVIDPAVIDVDWTVDGETTEKGGTTFDTSTLAPGTHRISAKAYDNATTDLVKYRDGTCPDSVTGRYCHRTAWMRSQQTVSWVVTKE
jgi:hypothetical protein